MAAGAALVVNLISMLAEERRTQLGVLRALGLTRRGLVLLSIMREGITGRMTCRMTSCRNLDWFSQTGVKPTLIQADIQPAIPRSVGQADLSALYRAGATPGTLTAAVPRSSLWRAAMRMVLDHPWGVGPDNFRLQYGKYLGASRWDTHIYANSLYLELLSGSGVVGLAAFGFLIFSIRWRAQPVCLAIAVFLVHGLVDVFLMTTPIYFAFWILAGTDYTN